MQSLQAFELRIGDTPPRQFQHRDTRSDRGVIAQMFDSQDYALGRLRRGGELQDRYEALARGARRPWILDAGANIGASAVYFASAFPRAHVVALEPARDNFSLLQANAAGLDIDARCAAIGAAAGEMALVDPGEGEWGYRVLPQAGGERVPVIAAGALVDEKRAQGFEPFIAKIDIEGGEDGLFAAHTGWAERFPLLIIELHDWLLPRSGNSRNFLRWAAAQNRDFVFIGENIFSIAND